MGERKEEVEEEAIGGEDEKVVGAGEEGKYRRGRTGNKTGSEMTKRMRRTIRTGIMPKTQIGTTPKTTIGTTIGITLKTWTGLRRRRRSGQRQRRR